MYENVIRTRQAVCLLVLFTLGSTVVLAPSREAGRDMWMSALVALLMAVPLALLYGRLLQLFPEDDFFDMQVKLLGPVFGRVVWVVFTIYSIHLGALIIRNFTEYIQIVSFPYDPQYLFALPFGILCIWSVRAGVDTLKRWSILLFPVYLGILVLITLLSIQLWNPKNITPILYNGFTPVLKGSFDILTFPFMETILLCFLFKPKLNQRMGIWVYLLAFAVSAVTLAMVYLRNNSILSYEQATKLLFPSYESISLINIGDFIQGIQAVIVMLFLFGGMAKASVCMFVAALGTSKLTRLDYRAMAAPVGLVIITFSLFVSKNAQDMVQWAAVYYKYYVLPVGLFIPLLLWAVAEWKHHRAKRQLSGPQEEKSERSGTRQEGEPDAGGN